MEHWSGHHRSRIELAPAGVSNGRKISLRQPLFLPLVALWFLCVLFSEATAQTGCAAYPNLLTNGTPADASSVMSNFNSILGCVNQRTGGFRNRIINGNFVVNQRGYTTNATLAVGAYAHDRWRAGTANTRYTFSQLPSDTTVTIAAGTLVQVVENVNVEGGSYTLSWSGTAQARVGVGGAAPAGTFAGSPVAISSAPAGQSIAIEFNTGTLGVVQLEPATVRTAFERRPLPIELLLCQRYYERVSFAVGEVVGIGTAATQFAPPFAQFVVISWKVAKRSTPTVASSPASTFSVAGSAANSVGFGGNVDRAWASFQASAGSTVSSWSAVPVTAASAAWIEGNSEL